jgi:hypothetical protein
MERRLGPERGQMGARDERKASSSLSWLGVVTEQRLHSEDAKRDHTFRPNGSGIISSSPPVWVSERRTRLLSLLLYAYQLVR